jgi:hypothetical protein
MTADGVPIVTEPVAALDDQVIDTLIVPGARNVQRASGGPNGIGERRVR